MLAATLGALLVAGCGQQAPSPTRLTTEEAQAFAIMRFNNYSEHRLHVRIETTTDAVEFSARAVLDLHRRAGFAEYTTVDPDTGKQINKGTLAWSDHLIETAEGGDFADPPGQESWTERSLSAGNTIDVLLVLALNLGADRPENPALLRQSGARLLRTEEDDGKKVYVISGPGRAYADTDSGSPSSPSSTSPSPSDRPTAGGSPAGESGGSPTTYWVDGDGTMSKFAADLGGAEPATITVVAAGGFPDRIPPRIYRNLRMKR